MTWDLIAIKKLRLTEVVDSSWTAMHFKIIQFIDNTTQDFKETSNGESIAYKQKGCTIDYIDEFRFSRLEKWIMKPNLHDDIVIGLKHLMVLSLK